MFFWYTLGDLFIPFTGPYRPEAVGLGTLAYWIIVIVGLSFPFKKRLGHATWKKLHCASYTAFGMDSLHGLFAGTEGTNLGLQLLIGMGILLVVLLLGIRVGKNQVKPVAKSRDTHGLSQSDRAGLLSKRRSIRDRIDGGWSEPSPPVL